MSKPDQASERSMWRYVGEQADGKVARGEVVAKSEDEALRQVRALGLTPLNIKAQAERSSLFGGQSNQLNAAEALSLVRGVADLVSAGLPLKDVLTSLAERETRQRLKAAILRIENRLKQGDSFSAALRADPAGLPRSMIALAEAGEESGLLGRNYTDLADQMERDQDLRQELIGQLIYPTVLMVVIGGALLFLAHFVLPQFESIFSDARTEPPAITVFVLDAGRFLRAWGVWIPAIVLLVILAVRGLASMAPLAVERFLTMIPLLGSTRVRVEAVRYCRVLGLLISAGTPLARAETVAREAIESTGLRQRHALAAEGVRAGETFSASLSRTRALPEDALRLIALGEKSGHLDTMLLRAADLYDREVRTRLKGAVELIGPAMIAILGLCVGGVIAAVMMGVLSLNEVVF
jgi:type II secretory pathway component PulF